MFAYLPILIVAVPLFAAPLCILARRTVLAWILAVGCAIFTLTAATQMLAVSLDGTVLIHHLGGWEPPWGIAYRVATSNAFIALLIAFVFSIVLLYAKCSVLQELRGGRPDIFFAICLLLLSGLMGVVISHDLFNIFIFLEIASLSGYALVAFKPGGRAPLAAFRYLVIGTLGATLFLIGIGYIYALTGTLNLSDIAQRLTDVAETRPALAAFAFIGVGLMLKMALFPLHQWLPDVYTQAPATISALLSAVSAKVSLYLFMTLFFQVFQIHTSEGAGHFDTILLSLSMAAILFGAIAAIGQTNVKRMMAYSSVSQIGYLTLSLGLASIAGMTASLIHMFNHAFIKGGLFLALGGVIYRCGNADLSSFAGLGKRMPYTAAAIVVGGLSLIGIPLTNGFISKWFLISALWEQGFWFFIALVLLGSLLSVVYVWQVIEQMYARPPADRASDTIEAPFILLGPIWVFAGLNVYLGIHASGLVQVAQISARILLKQ